MIAGIDGCRNAWLAITDRLETHVLSGDDELIAFFARCDVAAIDIPIGLSEEEGRACDRAAREKLGRRWMCVFPAPVRSLLHLDYPTANRIAKTRGKGISRQGHALYPKVAQIDRILHAHPELRARVYEVHPEVSFTEWNDGLPLPVSKHKHEGRALRRDLALAHFGAIPPTPRGAKEDDVLDALAALWTAERIRGKVARVLGDDGVGTIVY